MVLSSPFPGPPPSALVFGGSIDPPAPASENTTSPGGRGGGNHNQLHILTCITAPILWVCALAAEPQREKPQANPRVPVEVRQGHLRRRGRTHDEPRARAKRHRRAPHATEQRARVGASACAPAPRGRASVRGGGEPWSGESRSGTPDGRWGGGGGGWPPVDRPPPSHGPTSRVPRVPGVAAGPACGALRSAPGGRRKAEGEAPGGGLRGGRTIGALNPNSAGRARGRPDRPHWTHGGPRNATTKLRRCNGNETEHEKRARHVVSDPCSDTCVKGGKKIALRGAGGMARKPICPTPPSPSLAGVPGGGLGWGCSTYRAGGGGSTPNMCGSKCRADHFDYTYVGEIFWWKKFFSGPKFVFRCLLRQHPSLHKTEGPARKPISGTPPPHPLLRRAPMPSPPPPPPAKQFLGRQEVIVLRGSAQATTRGGGGAGLGQDAG